MSTSKPPESSTAQGRREFLARCGKFAAVTTPSMVLLFSQSGQNYATAGSLCGFQNDSASYSRDT